jgi:PAS domain S-box-containing protein
MVVVTDLIYNLSILVALSSFSGFIARRWERTTVAGKILQGLLFGGVVILGMTFPFELEKGLIFDGRTIVIGLCTLFFGTTAGAISAAMAGIYRLWIGGVGLPTGLSTIIMAFVAGLVFHRIRSRFPIEWLTNLRLYLFGLAIHIFMMILVVTLPSQYVVSVYQTIGITIIGIYPLVTLIIGKILFDQEIASHTLSELGKRESLFRTTLYSIGDAVITTDEKGNIRNMNQIAENLTGWKESEVKGNQLKEVFQIVNEFTLEAVENPVQKVLREGVVVGLANHSLLISRDGRKIPIADSGAPIRDENGEIIGVVLVFRDQTAERETQRKIKESELRYQQFVHFSNDGIWRYDLDPGRVLQFPLTYR